MSANQRQTEIAQLGAQARDHNLDNLRALSVLLVLLVHSVVAYMTLWPTRAPRFKLTSAPIIDVARWAGFDLIVAFADSFVMALMFLLSGIFVWPSLKRKGVSAFLRDRVIRLGIPLALVLGLIMPLAYYPSYAVTGAEKGFSAYFRAWLSLGVWPSGHAWFIWVLVVFDLLAAIFYGLAARRTSTAAGLPPKTANHPFVLVAAILVLSTLAYVPLAMHVGPDRWLTYGPFSFQASRPILYGLYFVIGVLIGALHLDRDILAPRAQLPRLWAGWLITGIAVFAIRIAVLALYILPATAAQQPVPFVMRLFSELTLVLCCGTLSLGLLALFRSSSLGQKLTLGSLSANSYGIYLVHYAFVIWLQFALLEVQVSALAKASIVFSCTLGLSWGIVAMLRRVPGVAHVL